jgi:cytidine deaminase
MWAVPRVFIRQIDPANIQAEVVLGWDGSRTLAELLPDWEWSNPLMTTPPA